MVEKQIKEAQLRKLKKACPLLDHSTCTMLTAIISTVTDKNHIIIIYAYSGIHSTFPGFFGPKRV